MHAERLLPGRGRDGEGMPLPPAVGRTHRDVQNIFGRHACSDHLDLSEGGGVKSVGRNSQWTKLVSEQRQSRRGRGEETNSWLRLPGTGESRDAHRGVCHGRGLVGAGGSKGLRCAGGTSENTGKQCKWPHAERMSIHLLAAPKPSDELVDDEKADGKDGVVPKGVAAELELSERDAPVPPAKSFESRHHHESHAQHDHMSGEAGPVKERLLQHRLPAPAGRRLSSTGSTRPIGVVRSHELKLRSTGRNMMLHRMSRQRPLPLAMG
eukprot:scaffold5720_cov127-Isochrysis_galbana.AAC.4